MDIDFKFNCVSAFFCIPFHKLCLFECERFLYHFKDPKTIPSEYFILVGLVSVNRINGGLVLRFIDYTIVLTVRSFINIYLKKHACYEYVDNLHGIAKDIVSVFHHLYVPTNKNSIYHRENSRLYVFLRIKSPLNIACNFTVYSGFDKVLELLKTFFKTNKPTRLEKNPMLSNKDFLQSCKIEELGVYKGQIKAYYRSFGSSVKILTTRSDIITLSLATTSFNFFVFFISLFYTQKDYKFIPKYS